MTISAQERLQSRCDTGIPRVFLQFAVAIGLCLFGATGVTAASFSDANWTPLGSGLNDAVYALAGSGSNLYVGGRFTMAGGATANRIAKWDGHNWSALGSGTDGDVYALALVGTNLYAGGSFLMAGGVSNRFIAKWNGSTWSSLGGMSGGYYVTALAVSGTDLYVGGSFTGSGFTTLHNIGKWNASGWSALGTGMNNTVHAIAVSGSTVYAGGDFSTADGLTAPCIAKWNGFGWSALGTGMGGNSFPGVFALAVSGSTLYAGGLFGSAGTAAAADLARWDGGSWFGINAALTAGTNYYPAVSSLALVGTNLYVGGDFTKASGSTVNRMVKWNFSGWSALGSGMDTNVNALLVSGTDLYAGGSFTNAGGKPCSYIARAYLQLPTLSIGSSGNSVTVSWPSADTADFLLEESNDPVWANWVANTGIITDDGTNRSVSVTATNDHVLFRLRRP